MKAFPKSLIIGGVRWSVVLDKKTRGGGFFWKRHVIKIEKDYSRERRFQVLIHEVCEAILVNNVMRFEKGFSGDPSNGDYLFSFDHDKFEIFSDELAGIIKQIFGEAYV